LESVVTAKRDKAAALKFLKRVMKTFGRPRSVVSDGLCSYHAAMKKIGYGSSRGRPLGSTIGRRIRISLFDDANEHARFEA
jgi:putative transposase